MTQLKAEVNNPELPIISNVILKNYVTTTEDNQYIDLSSILTSFLDGYKGVRHLAFDAEFMIVDKTAKMAAFNVRKHILGAALLSEYVSVGEVGQSNRNTVQTTSAINNTLYTVTCKTERVTVSGSVKYIVKTSINDVLQTSTDYLLGGGGGQAAAIEHMCAFGYSTNNDFTTFTSKAGALKIKSLKIYNYEDVTNSSYIEKAELVPAIVDDVPCLYDLLNKQVYTANTGSLSVE